MELQYRNKGTYSYNSTSIGATGAGGSAIMTPATTIYIAPNGNDANAGSQPGDPTRPVLTLPIAFSILGSGGADTVCVVRNGFSGDMVFELGGVLTLASGEKLCCEVGDYATIEIGTGELLDIEDDCLINGIKFNIYDGQRSVVDTGISVSQVVTSNRAIFINCDFQLLQNATASIICLHSCTFLTCYFYNNSLPIEGETSTINDRVAIWREGNSDFDILISNSVISKYNTVLYYRRDAASASRTIRSEFNFFINNNTIFRLANGSGASGMPIDVDFSRSLIANTAAVFECYGDNSYSRQAYASSIFFNSIKPVFQPTQHSYNFTNEQFISAMLLVDYDDFINNDNINSAKLQLQNMPVKEIGPGKYYIESPIPYATFSIFPPNRASPFQQEVTLVSAGYNELIDFDYIAKSLTIENRYINRVNNYDVNGNIHTYYRTRRRRFVFSYGSDWHIPNRLLKQINNLYSDTGSKKLYLKGVGENLLETDMVSSGVFDSTDNSFTPILTYTLIPKNWQGFWLNMDGEEYYISDNDDTKLYLVDKNNVSFPASGSYSVTIEYILVNITAEMHPFVQSFFTDFNKGGGLAEYSDEARPYDYTTETIVFEEIEDPEEND